MFIKELAWKRARPQKIHSCQTFPDLLVDSVKCCRSTNVAGRHLYNVSGSNNGFRLDLHKNSFLVLQPNLFGVSVLGLRFNLFENDFLYFDLFSVNLCITSYHSNTYVTILSSEQYRQITYILRD